MSDEKLDTWFLNPRQRAAAAQSLAELEVIVRGHALLMKLARDSGFFDKKDKREDNDETPILY